MVLWANYFQIKVPNDLTLHRYEIKEPSPSAGGKKKAQLVKLLLEQLPGRGSNIITDFGSILLSLKKLDKTKYDVTYRTENEAQPRQGARVYTLEVEYKNVLTVADLRKHLAAPNSNVDVRAAMVQALNICLNHYGKTAPDLITFGSSRTFRLRSADDLNIGTCVKAMRGFFASVRLATSRVLVNVNVNQALFYRESVGQETLLDLMDNHAEENNDDDYKLASFLRRLRVMPNLKTKDGKLVHGARTIFGLATMDDGKPEKEQKGVKGKDESQHPPKVTKFAANAEDVQFWYAEEGQRGEYITVSKFFEKSKNRVPIITPTRGHTDISRIWTPAEA